MCLTNQISLLRHTAQLGLVALLALALTGCRSGSNKVAGTLSRAESELEKSATSLKGLDRKPAREAINELDRVYESHQRVLEELTGLAKESFTQQEKERYQRVLARARERQAQIKEATAKGRAALKH
jgi:Na+/phosphate symporter